MAEIEDESGEAITDADGDAILDMGPMGYTNSKDGGITPAGAPTRNFNGSRSTTGDI